MSNHQEIQEKAAELVDVLADMICTRVLNEVIARLEGSLGGVTERVAPAPKAKKKPGPKPKKTAKASSKPGRKAKLDDLTDSQRKVYDLIKAAKQPIATAALAKKYGASVSTTLYHLKRLERDRFVKRMREGHTVYFQIR